MKLSHGCLAGVVMASVLFVSPALGDEKTVTLTSTQRFQPPQIETGHLEFPNEASVKVPGLLRVIAGSSQGGTSSLAYVTSSEKGECRYRGPRTGLLGTLADYALSLRYWLAGEDITLKDLLNLSGKFFWFEECVGGKPDGRDVTVQSLVLTPYGKQSSKMEPFLSITARVSYRDILMPPTPTATSTPSVTPSPTPVPTPSVTASPSPTPIPASTFLKMCNSGDTPESARHTIDRITKSLHKKTCKEADEAILSSKTLILGRFTEEGSITGELLSPGVFRVWSKSSMPEISDLSPLSSYTHLESINIAFGFEKKISDISPLENLVNLKSIYLADHDIADLSPLAHLTKLESISLSDNKISNISPLKNLTNLRKVWLSFPLIDDVSPLASLPNLEEVTSGFPKNQPCPAKVCE